MTGGIGEETPDPTKPGPTPPPITAGEEAQPSSSKPTDSISPDKLSVPGGATPPIPGEEAPQFPPTAADPASTILPTPPFDIRRIPIQEYHQPQSNADSTDLSAGSVGVVTKFDINDALTEERARRKMRWIAFGVLGVLCSIYLVCLVVALTTLFLNPETLAIVSTVKDWHFLTLLGIALVIFAAIPLSLSLALVRMISGKGPGDEKQELSITTPQLELFKVIIEAAKAFKL